MKRWVMVALVAGVTLAGCSGRVPPVKTNPRLVSCLGMADDIKTLQIGDELPRVLQVLGEPQNAYRAYSPFGHSYDVIEYDTGESPCARAVLHSGKMLRIVFDDKGGYAGNGDSGFFRIKRATTVRTEPLLIDPVVFKP